MLIVLFIIEGLLFFLLKQAFSGLHANLDVISTIIIAIHSIIFFVILTRYTKTKGEYVILFLAYALRLFFLYWDIYARHIFILPNSGADSEMFHHFAVQFALGGDASRGGFYSIVVGLIYTMFGEQRILAQYANILFSLYTILLLKKMMEELSLSTRVRRTMLVVIAFLPNYMVISSILLRESVIILLLTLSLFFFMKWWQNGRFGIFLVAMIFPMIAALFHSGAIAQSVAIGVCYILYRPANKKFLFSFKTITAGLLFSCMFLFIHAYFGEVVFSKFQDLNSVTDVSAKVSSYTSGSSAYLGNQQVESIPQMIVYTPVRMVYFIASPMPWDFRGLTDIFAFLFSGMFFIISYFLAFYALKQQHHPYKSLIIALLMMAIFSALVFAWGVSNAGTALRHREKFFPIYALMLAVSACRIKQHHFMTEVECDGDGKYHRSSL